MRVEVFDEHYQDAAYNLVWNVMVNVVKRDPIVLKEELRELENIKEYCMPPHDCFWVAVDETDEVVGTVGLRRVREDLFYMERFYVHEDYRSKGIGSLLYEKVEEFVLKHSGKYIYLFSGKHLTTAHRFYLSHNYVIYYDNGVDPVGFYKELIGTNEKTVLV